MKFLNDFTRIRNMTHDLVVLQKFFFCTKYKNEIIFIWRFMYYISEVTSLYMRNELKEIKKSGKLSLIDWMEFMACHFWRKNCNLRIGMN